MTVLKIAGPGGEVTDDEKDLSFTSERQCLMEKASGVVSITTDGYGVATHTISHGLGYIPTYYTFEKDFFGTGAWFPKYIHTTYADESNIYIEIDWDPNTTYYIYYYIAYNRNDNATGSGNSNVSGKLRIAKEGYDATEDTDIRRFNFVSGASVHKLDTSISGSSTQSVGASYPAPTTITISHGLGYVPVCFVFWDDVQNKLPYIIPVYDSDTANYYMDTSNLYIEARWGGGITQNATFRYQIFRDKIA